MADYQSLLVQIVTPYSVGTGFYIHEDGWIVTNEQVVRDSKTVVVDRPGFRKQIGDVYYLDPKTDLALLRVAEVVGVPAVNLQKDISLKVGQLIQVGAVLAEGDIVVKRGTILEPFIEVDGLSYFQHSEMMSGSDSGGPIWSDVGVLLGMSVSVYNGGVIVGFGIPLNYIKDALSYVMEADGKTVCRCYQCATIVYDDNPMGNNCPSCREEIQLPSLIPAYQPTGVSSTIEKLLSEIVDEVALTRRGPYSWQVEQGSAEINISYYEKNGLIVGDAHLCTLPLEENEALYAYLLSQNYKIENLTFSIRNEDIVLSLMIYDRYLNEGTGRNLFRYLFEQADAFDNLLVEIYGAKWKKVKS